MVIRVIGAGCKECDTLFKNVMEAVREVDENIEVKRVEDLVEIVMLGVMTAPSVMIDDKLVFSGRVASKQEIVEKIKKYK